MEAFICIYCPLVIVVFHKYSGHLILFMFFYNEKKTELVVVRKKKKTNIVVEFGWVLVYGICWVFHCVPNSFIVVSSRLQVRACAKVHSSSCKVSFNFEGTILLGFESLQFKLILLERWTNHHVVPYPMS